MTTKTLAAKWIIAKALEKAATDNRREIEDQLTKDLGLAPDLEGAETSESEGYKIKVTGRINRKVDPAKLQEIALEQGTTAQLSSLFRWKPEIASAAGKAADSSITAPLLGAITATPGRPSYSITKEDKE